MATSHVFDPHFTDACTADWLALHTLTTDHPIRAQELLRAFRTPSLIMHAPRAALEQCHDASLSDAQWDAICALRAAVDWPRVAHLQQVLATFAAAHPVQVLACTAPDYPRALAQIADPPLLLFVRGEVAALRVPTVAIVGTRKPTRYGRAITECLTDALVARGLSVTSGLAFGIDSVAHRRVLAARGITVGVLASGIDDITPRAHYALGREIALTHGALLSEYLPGTPSYAAHYPQRNRIISGLAAVTVVIECTSASGTMWTAKHALEQNRHLFALPGPIDAALSAGPNFLIAQGATPMVDVSTAAAQIAQIIRRFHEQL